MVFVLIMRTMKNDQRTRFKAINLKEQPFEVKQEEVLENKNILRS